MNSPINGLQLLEWQQALTPPSTGYTGANTAGGCNAGWLFLDSESRMIELLLPELPEYEIPLEPDGAARGKHEATGATALSGRVALGGPYSIQITPDYVAGDSDLREFIKHEAEHSIYHLVHLSVSFIEDRGAPRLDAATLELKLTSPVGNPQPTAWSMSPLRITDPVQVERRFTLGPHLKLGDAEISGGEFEQTASWQRGEVFLQAQRELRSDPAWQFRHTRTMRLYGAFRLIMVVRAGRNQAVNLTGTVLAATKGNLLRRYRGELPAAPPLEATV
jgi:hypothetical protein